MKEVAPTSSFHGQLAKVLVELASAIGCGFRRVGADELVYQGYTEQARQPAASQTCDNPLRRHK